MNKLSLKVGLNISNAGILGMTGTGEQSSVNPEPEIPANAILFENNDQPVFFEGKPNEYLFFEQ